MDFFDEAIYPMMLVGRTGEETPKEIVDGQSVITQVVEGESVITQVVVVPSTVIE
jgi:hypothetical protein